MARETFRGYPVFYGEPGEDAQDFVENLNACCRLEGKRTPAEWVEVLACVVRRQALAWFDSLPAETRNNPEAVKEAFQEKYVKVKSAEALWRVLEGHRQAKIEDFEEYKAHFERLWHDWERRIQNLGAAADFLKRERFVSGLHPMLRAKVEENEPTTYADAVGIASHKARKINFRRQRADFQHEALPIGAPHARIEVGEHSHVEPVLQRVVAPPVTTDALEDLTRQIKELNINFAQGIQARQNDAPRERDRERGRDRDRDGDGGAGRGRVYQCWNCGERGHGMYNCPWPRGVTGNPTIAYPVAQAGRGEVPIRPILRQRNGEEVPIVQPPAPPPAPAGVPPLPERDVHAAEIEECKGSKDDEDKEVHGIRKTRDKGKGVAMEEDAPRKRSKREEPTLSKKHRRRIGLHDFILGHGEEPYSLVQDLKKKGPNISWPQFFALCPKVRHELSKSVSTRLKKTKFAETRLMHVAPALWEEDVQPVVDCSIKGRVLPKTLIDGGAQICIMADHVVQSLGLRMREVLDVRVKMANNSKAKCLGIVKGVKVEVLGVRTYLDFFVVSQKGTGYPLILGRPWLLSIGAVQDWDKKQLVLKDKEGKQKVIYDMSQQRQRNIQYEESSDVTIEEYIESDEEYSSTTDDESSLEDSSIEVMGVRLGVHDGGKIVKEEALSIEDSQDKMAMYEKMLSSTLSREEREDFKSMLQGFPFLFAREYTDIRGVEVIEHHILIKSDAAPVAQKLRRMGNIREEALLKELKRLLEAGFIYPVEHAEWISPVVVTPKKNGKWRVCVDYRPLNGATKRDHFPLPFQDEILNEVAGHEKYTVCDGYSGYFQIRIAEEDQRKTTFITPWGCFAYRVMPFGLTNAPATFQRFMNLVFQDFFGKSIRVFIDDFCIYSPRVTHVQKVEEGLKRLDALGGQLNPDKCHIGEDEVILLGHKVSARGIEVDPSKVKALVELPSPTSVKELISFTQKVTYLSRFIYLSSQVLYPFQRLAQHVDFCWNEELEEYFLEVKRVLSALPILMSPHWEEVFFVNPSVGKDSLGAALLQKDETTSRMRPIYFASRVLGDDERRYSESELLMDALMFAVRKFRSYLLHRPFVVLTVESLFPWAAQQMNSSSRIAKWLMELQEYDYTFKVEDSMRAQLADLLTYRVHEKVMKGVDVKKMVQPDISALDNAFTLFFDGAYRRKTHKAGGGLVLLDPQGGLVWKDHVVLEDVKTNNEAEYEVLIHGLRRCVEQGIIRLMVKGDALLLVKQVVGVWSCKSDRLRQKMKSVRDLMSRFSEVRLYHIPRKENQDADGLAKRAVEEDVEVVLMAAHLQEPRFEGLESLRHIVHFMHEGEYPADFTKDQKRALVKKASSYVWIEDALYQRGKDLVLRRIPKTEEILDILMSCHDYVCGGHFAQDLTAKKILLMGYVWPSLHVDVAHWCRSCHACQINGDKKLTYGPRQPIVSYGPFEKWGIDAIGPLPRTSSGKIYILLAVDYMTRWVEGHSVARVNGKTVTRFVYTHICCRFGTPLEIVSDSGPGFTKGLLDEVLPQLNVRHSYATPYYPQSNGLVEKANGVICKIIRKMVGLKPKTWDTMLDGALWAYRTTYKGSLQFTPYHLVYGHEALQPIMLEIPNAKLHQKARKSQEDIWVDRLLDLVELEWKRDCSIAHFEQQALKKKRKFDELHLGKDIKEGSLVLRYDSKLDTRYDVKFVPRWEGPFVVVKAYTKGYYHLADLDGKMHKRKVNGYRLKPYFLRMGPSLDHEGQQTHTVRGGEDAHGSGHWSLDRAYGSEEGQHDQFEAECQESLERSVNIESAASSLQKKDEDIFEGFAHIFEEVDA